MNSSAGSIPTVAKDVSPSTFKLGRVEPRYPTQSKTHFMTTFFFVLGLIFYFRDVDPLPEWLNFMIVSKAIMVAIMIDVLLTLWLINMLRML